MLVTVNPIAGEYYNIGGTYTCTIEEMLNTLISKSKVKGIKIETDPDRVRPIDADLQVPDTSKFQKHTGWKPEIPYDVTMQDLLDYWRHRIGRGAVPLQR
jgi:GDPmannose 4,6-dehydratase